MNDDNTCTREGATAKGGHPHVSLLGASLKMGEIIRGNLREAWDLARLRARFPDTIIGEGCLIRGADHLTMGPRSFIDVHAYLNCSGGAWNDFGGFIRIGANSEIGPYAVLWGAGGITIGDNVHIGPHVTITAHEAIHVPPASSDVFRSLEMEFAEVVIEDHVLICSGTAIIPGVRIGHHSMIGAGAVVINDIPPRSLAVGCPARVVKTYDDSEICVPVRV